VDSRDARPGGGPESVDLGAGLWQAAAGRWELVRVLHHEDRDVFFFSLEHSQYTYGATVGGYGRDELATLYLGEKLTLHAREADAVPGAACGRRIQRGASTDPQQVR
jgi:hypothetical protein